MRSALFLAIGVALSSYATADEGRCVVSFSAARHNVCDGTITPFNTQLDALAKPEAVESSTLRLIKFDGPIDRARRAAVESIAEIISYAPFNAYVVRMAPALDARARAIPGVIWSGPFLPAFKIDPNIASELASGTLAREMGAELLDISLVESASRKTTQAALQRIAGLSEVRPLQAVDPARFVAKFERTQLRTTIEQLALDPDVIAVGLSLPPRLLNSQADWLHQSNIYTPTPLTPVFDRGIYGCGQIVGVLDSGLYLPHCSFSDPLQSPAISHCTNGSSCPPIAVPNTAARKVIAYYKWAPSAVDKPEDRLGHGTGVAAAIAGQNPADAVDCDTFTTPGGNTDLDGTAPGAKLVIQEITGSYFQLNGGIYHAADMAYLSGARLHNNSWGSSCLANNGYVWWSCRITYNASTRDADRIAKDREDLVLLFAAGNDGQAAAPGHSINSPGNAKNVITVGTTARGTAANARGGSSYGPTYDSRTKPDITAQGQYIVTADRNACGSTTLYIGRGASMSAPTAAGLAALVREYLQRGFYPTGRKVAANAIAHPSSALIKAVLISGAARMTGGTIGPSPGQGQGWGRILLDDSLYFDGDSSRLYLHDASIGLETGALDTHTLAVSAGAPLNITLAWTDTAAAVGAEPALVNALRLEVVAPDGKTWTQKLLGPVGTENADPTQSTTMAGYDDRNNVHRIHFADPQAGTYTLRVRGINVPSGPQKYALAATGNLVVDTAGRADFLLETAPSRIRVCAGQSAALTLGARGLGGFAGTVDLSVAGLPGNATGTFTPNSVTAADPPGTSQFSIGTAGGMASNTYSLVLRGASTSPALQRTAAATLDVVAAVPTATGLIEPYNGAQKIATPTTFRWSPRPDTERYRLQVSTSPLFDSIVDDQVVTGTRHTSTMLFEPEQTYYWRVIGHNLCGDSTESPTFSFTTAAQICSNPDLAIADGDAGGVTDTQTVYRSGTLSGLRLYVSLSHTNVSDLTLSLSKGDTSVVLMQRPGDQGGSAPPGCLGNDANVLVDDNAYATLEGNCAASTNYPAYEDGFAYKPNQPLAAFQGAHMQGPWTLRVTDGQHGDTGVLHRWCVLPVINTDAIFADGWE